MTLNLRHLVHEVMASGSVEYGDIAAEVARRINDKDLRAALAQALTSYVRHVAVAQRQAGAVTPPSAAPTMPGSWKVAAIRDHWQKRLLEIYSTEDGNKRLGDFTVADLQHQAEICSRQAKQKLSKAKGWRNLADLMADQGVQTVRELPAEMLMKTLGTVAA